MALRYLLPVQMRFMAANGFLGLEDNGMLKRPAAEQKLIGDTLKRLGMTMGVFVIEGFGSVVGHARAMLRGATK